MTMSAEKRRFLAEIMNGEPIPAAKLEYFRARLSNKFHEAVLDLFARTAKEHGLTKSQLARRIGKDAAQITRILGTPANWELATISDLLIGMGFEVDLMPRHVAAERGMVFRMTTFSPPPARTYGTDASPRRFRRYTLRDKPRVVEVN